MVLCCTYIKVYNQVTVYGSMLLTYIKVYNQVTVYGSMLLLAP